MSVQFLADERTLVFKGKTYIKKKSADNAHNHNSMSYTAPLESQTIS